MAISYIRFSEDNYNSATLVNSRSVSIDAGSGSNRLLVVGVSMRAASVRSVTSMTYNGVDMTRVDRIDNITPSPDIGTELWFLPDPAAGTNTLIVNFNDTLGQIYLCCPVFASNTAAITLDQKNTGSGNSGTPSVSVTPTSDNQVVVCHMLHESTAALSNTTGTLISAFDSGAYVHGDSYVIQTTAQAQAMSWSGTTDEYAMVVASFKESSLSTTSTKTQTGLARIQKTVGQTIQGVARIQRSEAKTQTGVARVTTVSTQNQTGLSRIESTSNQTLQGVSRVTAVTAQTLTGKASITGSDTYSREAKTTLPATTDNLATVYTAGEVTDVASVDGVLVGVTGANYLIHLFKVSHSPNTDSISVSWTGQTTLSPVSSAVYLQIYNYTTSAWETLTSNNTASINTNFTLSSSITTNVSNYYSPGSVISARVYQVTI